MLKNNVSRVRPCLASRAGFGARQKRRVTHVLRPCRADNMKYALVAATPKIDRSIDYICSSQPG